jgi:hypothetical protein
MVICSAPIQRFGVMGIWKTIKAAFGRGTSTPPDAPRLNAVDELALSASLGALADEETGWITLSEARALFGEMDQVGKAVSSRLQRRESIDLFPSSCPPRGGSTSPERQLDTRLYQHRAHPDAGTKRIRIRCISKRRTEPGSTRQFVSKATRPGSRVAFWPSVRLRRDQSSWPESTGSPPPQ